MIIILLSLLYDYFDRIHIFPSALVTSAVQIRGYRCCWPPVLSSISHLPLQRASFSPLCLWGLVGSLGLVACNACLMAFGNLSIVVGQRQWQLQWQWQWLVLPPFSAAAEVGELKNWPKRFFWGTGDPPFSHP